MDLVVIWNGLGGGVASVARTEGSTAGAMGMTNRQEVTEVQRNPLEALAEGTPHRRGKGVDPEHRIWSGGCAETRAPTCP